MKEVDFAESREESGQFELWLAGDVLPALAEVVASSIAAWILS